MLQPLIGLHSLFIKMDGLLFKLTPQLEIELREGLFKSKRNRLTQIAQLVIEELCQVRCELKRVNAELDHAEDVNRIYFKKIQTLMGK